MLILDEDVPRIMMRESPGWELAAGRERLELEGPLQVSETASE